jgi:uncharacterized protein
VSRGSFRGDRVRERRRLARAAGADLWQTGKGKTSVTATLYEILAEFRHGLERIYGPRLAELVLFGSRARDDSVTDSDIDVMVVLHGQVNPLQEARRISRFRGDLCLRHDAVISCVYLSLDEAQAGDSPLLQNIRAEGVAV